MAEVKWIKITTNMFEDEKIDFIESLPEADSILIIWIKLLTLAGKNNLNGYIFLTQNIPYTSEMLAHKFRRPLNTVKLALETLQRLEMIEFNGNTLKISNWEKHQNIEGLEKIREQTRKRVAKYRENQKRLDDSNVTVTLQVTEGNETEEDIDIEEERDIEDTTTSKYQIIIDSWNELGLAKIRSIKSNRLKMLKARINEYSQDEVIQAIKSIGNSSFLKGQNNRNWVITFDWFIKPNNFIKVLEGNYLDKEANNGSDNNRNGQAKKTTFTEEDADRAGVISL